MAEYIITLLADADLAGVTGRLMAAGFTVEQELTEIGVITGQADPAAVPALTAVAGVAAVEASSTVFIMPQSDPGISG